jgi:hypothetical protein
VIELYVAGFSSDWKWTGWGMYCGDFEVLKQQGRPLGQPNLASSGGQPQLPRQEGTMMDACGNLCDTVVFGQQMPSKLLCVPSKM